jgi:hypothetical protein
VKKRGGVAAFAAVALLVGPAGGSTAAAAESAAAAAPLACPATFQVLHNDRIGRLKLPQGHYRIRIIDDQALTCQRASKLFAKFLQDFDGNLPGRWRLQVSTATFSKRGTDKAFRVKKVGRQSGGGGGRHPSGRHDKCPTFRVLHNDRIGNVRFPRGTYQMTALGGFTCQKSSSKFAAFLELPGGNLPGRWRLRGRTGTFMRGQSGKGFQVNLWKR